MPTAYGAASHVKLVQLQVEASNSELQLSAGEAFVEMVSLPRHPDNSSSKARPAHGSPQVSCFTTASLEASEPSSTNPGPSQGSSTASFKPQQVLTLDRGQFVPHPSSMPSSSMRTPPNPSEIEPASDNYKRQAPAQDDNDAAATPRESTPARTDSVQSHMPSTPDTAPQIQETPAPPVLQPHSPPLRQIEVPSPPTPLANGDSFGSPVTTSFWLLSSALPASRRPNRGRAAPVPEVQRAPHPSRWSSTEPSRTQAALSAARVSSTGLPPHPKFTFARTQRHDRRSTDPEGDHVRHRSGSATRHPRAAFGQAMPSAGVSALRATRSSMDLTPQHGHSTDLGDRSALIRLDRPDGAQRIAPSSGETGAAAVSCRFDPATYDLAPRQRRFDVASSSRSSGRAPAWEPRRWRGPREKPAARSQTRRESSRPRSGIASTASYLSDSNRFELTGEFSERDGSAMSSGPLWQRRGSAAQPHALRESYSTDVIGSGNTFPRAPHSRSAMAMYPSLPDEWDTCASLSEAMAGMDMMLMPEGILRDAAVRESLGSQNAPLTRGRDRGRYLRLLRCGPDGTRAARTPEPPLGMPALNFQKYEFPMAQQFAFSDGGRVGLTGGTRRRG